MRGASSSRDLPLVEIIHFARVAELLYQLQHANLVAFRERMWPHHLIQVLGMPLYLSDVYLS